MKTVRRAASALALASGLAPGAPALADAELLAATCGGCHSATDAGLSRISGQRKTPEGWLMTIVRMRLIHGVEIPAADQAALVAYLADTQGLAPSETEGYRYALEKDPDVVEAFDEPFRSMCARCHTGARVMLQRRTPEEWALHMEFHVGQFPTVEYQALGRDRDWYQVARDEMAPMLAEMLPLETDAWTAWSAAEKPSVAGDWIVLTDLPGHGAAYGRLTVEGDAAPYTVSGEMRLADGTAAPVSGSLNLYTGYEWRANLTVGEHAIRQVLAVSEDGTTLAGRQFLRDRDSLGGPLTGVRADAAPTVLGAVPEAVAGSSAPVQIVGAGLDGLTVEGAEATDLAANDFGAAAVLTGAGDGIATLAAGETSANFAFYTTPDRLSVEPAFTIARVGGGGEAVPPSVPSGFKAIGWWNGPDGQPETEDDVRIGEVPATWTVANHNETAELMEDARWAGIMGESGIFEPAIAGPNPERRFSTNNAGELTVKAEALGLTGEGMLIVTVQRFIDPPIR